jgi:hypothetical protein
VCIGDKVAQVGRFLVLNIAVEYLAHSPGITGIPPANNRPIAGDNNSNFEEKKSKFQKNTVGTSEGGASAIMEFFYFMAR